MPRSSDDERDEEEAAEALFQSSGAALQRQPGIDDEVEFLLERGALDLAAVWTSAFSGSLAFCSAARWASRPCSVTVLDARSGSATRW